MQFPAPEFKAEYIVDVNQWWVYRTKFTFLKTNIDGDPVFDVETEVVFKGTITECESYIRLAKSGHLR